LKLRVLILLSKNAMSTGVELVAPHQ